MRRLSRSPERGATAVIVAILLVALFGFTALAVDIGAAWADKKQLQNGADAAAMAIAQQCAAGACPTDEDLEADKYTDANKFNATSTAIGTATIDPTQQTVTAHATENLNHWFAPVIGIDSSQVGATATAKWGRVSGGATLPLTFSVCSFGKQVPSYNESGLPAPGGAATEQVVYFTKAFQTGTGNSGDNGGGNNQPENPGCTGPSGNVVPGGFGWLAVEDSATCRTDWLTVGVDILGDSDTGKSDPCAKAFFDSIQNQVVLLPLFDNSGGTGTSAHYFLYGFAAFKVTGYNFVGGGNQWNCTPGSQTEPCNSSDRWIKGYFQRFVTIQEAFQTGGSAPPLGAAVVTFIG